MLLTASLVWVPCTWSQESAAPGEREAIPKAGPYTVRVAQLIQDRNFYSIYPNALPTLLRELRDKTSVNVDPEPIIISSFEDPVIFDTPFIYVNFGQRTDWTLTPLEVTNLKRFLERGGFLMVDAGITAEFLRDKLHGQHHSFAEWQARPELEEVMQQIFPTKSFRPLPRDHTLYSIFHQGLPDAAVLPDTVRDFVVNEKWPQGTYSMVGMQINGRLAVLATPIIAMGWGKTSLGSWETTIGFRIRESAPDLSEMLRTAAYSGQRFEVTREDNARDIIYCQQPGKPAWVKEPDGTYRVFRYYHSQEISEFAHLFYTQLGLNTLLYALTH